MSVFEDEVEFEEGGVEEFLDGLIWKIKVKVKIFEDIFEFLVI